MRGKLWCMTQSSDPSWQLYWVSVSHCVLTRKTFQPCHEREKKIDGAERKLSYQYNDIYILKKTCCSGEKNVFGDGRSDGSQCWKNHLAGTKKKNFEELNVSVDQCSENAMNCVTFGKGGGKTHTQRLAGSPAASGRADGRICNKCTEQHNRLRTPCGLKKNHCHRDRHYGASDVKVDADVDYNNAIKSFGSDGFVYKTHFSHFHFFWKCSHYSFSISQVLKNEMIIIFFFSLICFCAASSVGPCALEYTKLKTSDHFWTDPSANELVQRHRIHGAHRGQDVSAGRRPALGVSEDIGRASSKCFIPFPSCPVQLSCFCSSLYCLFLCKSHSNTFTFTNLVTPW